MRNDQHDLGRSACGLILAVRDAGRPTTMTVIRMTAKRDKQPTSSSPNGDARATSPGKAPAAFDLWLQRGLHKLFDDVASEPIPDELLRLIEDDRKA